VETNWRDAEESLNLLLIT